MAVAFAVVFLTTDGTVWWEWVILGVGIVAGIASGVLVKRERDSRAATQVAQGGAAGQQTASDKATNISINADHGSAAAYYMGKVNVGRQRRRGKRKES